MKDVRLVDTELRRFFRRRAVRWLIGLGLLLALVVNGVQLVRSSASTTYRRQDIFGTIPEQCRRGEREGVPIAALDCIQRYGTIVSPRSSPRATTVFYEEHQDRRVRVGRTFGDTVAGLGIALSLLGVLLGATFLAAEFGAAGLGTQLLFEPRRWRLYAAKAMAVFLGGAAAAVLLVLWTGLGQLVASALRGSTAGVDAAWLGHRLADAGRVGAACGLAGLCALAVGALARRTVVAVGIFFGVVIGTGFLSNSSWGRPLARMSPMNGIWALGSGEVSQPDNFAGLHTLAGAAFVAVAWAIGLSLLGAWWLARSEIR